ncbi:hypothetical protein EVAR_68785_1 [Eumeta japonica]|uniref:Uncharacterized protein n=1 Tax=Eumeta variegata TaxID=151549 RepID=A0A4C1ZA88_EUMVA|nr:hypothetical protein EVAR_68785_1 [Eumeta japonica]
MIDFKIVDDRLRSKVVDTRVYRDVNVNTGLILVVCRIKVLCQRWQHHAKMVTTELERIKVGKLQDQNVKDEYLEQLKDILGEIKQYELLELDELWKVTKFVLVGEAKKVCGVNKSTNVSKKDNEWWNFETRNVVSEKKKAWLELLSAKDNHRIQRNDVLKDKLNDAERTHKDAKMRAKEYVKR